MWKIFVWFKGINTVLDFENKKSAVEVYKEIIEAADSGDSWEYVTDDKYVYINGEEIVTVTMAKVEDGANQKLTPPKGGQK